jgi:hypothetical protein
VPRRGEIWWAFVDFAPASPFEVFNEETQEWEDVAAARLADDIHTGNVPRSSTRSSV